MTAYRCYCGPTWRDAGMHHDRCPALRRRRLATFWRRQTGFVGGVVEFIVWMAVASAALRALTLVLTVTAAVLGRMA